MQKDNRIRIALVDDHEIVRHGLMSFLAGIDDFNIIAEGGSVSEALEILSEYKPDILLLDMLLPDGNGIDVLRSTKSKEWKTRILILSSYSDADTAIPAVREGAAGYLLKDINPKNLAESIRLVHAGKLSFHADISAHLVSALNNPEYPGNILSEKNITDREADVVKLIANGLSNKEIAYELNISQLTVKTHVSHILEKLELDDRTQVAIFAHKNKLVE